MNRITILRLAAAAAAGVATLLVSEQLSPTDPATLVTSADARIGRPLTPMSYAGVARRTARRGAYVGAAAAGAAAAGAYYGSGCYQTTDAYGRVYTQCP
jgi:hypothetical protein